MAKRRIDTLSSYIGENPAGSGNWHGPGSWTGPRLPAQPDQPAGICGGLLDWSRPSWNVTKGHGLAHPQPRPSTERSESAHRIRLCVDQRLECRGYFSGVVSTLHWQIECDWKCARIALATARATTFAIGGDGGKIKGNYSTEVRITYRSRVPKIFTPCLVHRL